MAKKKVLNPVSFYNEYKVYIVRNFEALQRIQRLTIQVLSVSSIKIFFGKRWFGCGLEGRQK